MTKEKLYEYAFTMIRAEIGDDMYEYIKDAAMTAATLATIHGICVATDEMLEEAENV